MNKREIARAKRMDIIKATCRKAEEQGEILSYKKLVAYCMVEFKIARRTAKEYIDPLIEMGEIEVDKNG